MGMRAIPVLVTSLAASLGTLLPFSATWGAVKYIDSPPLAAVVRTPVGAVGRGELRVPIITWGGDMATILANGNRATTQTGSLFDKAGLELRLVREDVFSKQLERYLAGETPFLRGTLGMINMAADLLHQNPRTKPVVVYQMTWSTGGDALVVKSGIRTVRDLKGKTIALQAYGPHVDYLATILRDAGIDWSQIKIRWLPDLTATDASPMAALYEPDVDATFVIIPDALALTSGGTVGTGAEDSVKGARILLSTKTANRIVADVYAVRSDYFKANQDKVEAFVGALLEAQSKLQAVVRDRQAAPKPYQNVMTAAAKLLLDSEQAVADAEGLYADCEFVGLTGNVNFFTNDSYPRRFSKLNQEIQRSLKSFGLSKGAVQLAHAGWNYGALGSATGGDVTSQSRFEQEQVASLVARKQQQGSLDEGELFRFEVYFKPNQNDFAADLYRNAFERVIELASTYGGAIITVEGHSDPMGYLRKKKDKSPVVVLGRIKQAARNLSISRAQSVRDSIIQYAGARSIVLDPNQFAIVGHGIAQPATGTCGVDPCAPQNEKQWRSNMRVEFRILQVEAEAEVFKPL